MAASGRAASAIVLLGSIALGAAVLPAVAAPGSSPSPAPSICIWDPIGAAGPLYDAAKNYALTMQKQGTEIQLKPYTDERVAAEDFRVGQCDALLATSLRTRAYVAISTAVDYGGVTTIVRDGKIDAEASFEVVRKAIQVFASPAAAKLVVQERYELGGIVPAGPIYTFARDRAIFKQGFAGKRMPAFDHDKVQAYLIAKIGAQPVSSDINNFVQKFNNGGLDVIFAPAVAYQPLEIYRGVGTKGGVSRLPLAFSTMQLVFDKARFPAGFGEASRQYWAAGFDEALAAIRKAETSIPQAAWVDYAPEEAAAFVANQRETRVELAKHGYYNKQGLKILKRVRCSVLPGAAECGTPAEIEW